MTERVLNFAFDNGLRVRLTREPGSDLAAATYFLAGHERWSHTGEVHTVVKRLLGEWLHAQIVRPDVSLEYDVYGDGSTLDRVARRTALGVAQGIVELIDRWVASE